MMMNEEIYIFKEIYFRNETHLMTLSSLNRSIQDKQGKDVEIEVIYSDIKETPISQAGLAFPMDNNYLHRVGTETRLSKKDYLKFLQTITS